MLNEGLAFNLLLVPPEEQSSPLDLSHSELSWRESLVCGKEFAKSKFEPT